MNCFDGQVIGLTKVAASTELYLRYGISEEGKDYPVKVMLLWPSD